MLLVSMAVLLLMVFALYGRVAKKTKVQVYCTPVVAFAFVVVDSTGEDSGDYAGGFWDERTVVIGVCVHVSG